MADIRSAQVEAPFDAQSGLRFDPLRKDLAQNRLLGKTLRTNDNRIVAINTAA